MVFQPIHKKSAHGFTLVEVMMSVGIGAIVLTMLCFMLLQFSRTTLAIFSYSYCNHDDRISLERVAQDLREASAFISLNATNVVVTNSAGIVQLAYSSPDLKLYRISTNKTEVLLANCRNLNFSFYERNLTANGYENQKISTNSACRLIKMDWESIIATRGTNTTFIGNSAKFLNRRVVQ